VAQVPGGPLSFYRPLFVVWLRLNFILSEMSPWGWHLLSVVKHLSAAVLLGLLVWKLLRDRVAALVAGTLFAMHPAHTESVAWVYRARSADVRRLACQPVVVPRICQARFGTRQSGAGKSHRKSRKQILSNSKSRPSVHG